MRQAPACAESGTLHTFHAAQRGKTSLLHIVIAGQGQSHG